MNDDLMFLNDLDSDLFQRMGILAAFDSWERAKKFVSFYRISKRKNKEFIFSSFDELLTPFSPLFSDARASYPGNKRRRAHGRQSSFDYSSTRASYARVKQVYLK
jgi:hypothetical protein